MCTKCLKEGMFLPKHRNKKESSKNSLNECKNLDVVPITPYITDNRTSEANNFLLLDSNNIIESAADFEKVNALFQTSKELTDSEIGIPEESKKCDLSYVNILTLRVLGAGVGLLLFALIRKRCRYADVPLS